MSEVKGVITVSKTAYDMQQAQMRKLAERNAQLEKGLPTVPSEVEEENRALRAQTAALKAELEALAAAKASGQKTLAPLVITEKGAIGVLLRDKGFRYVFLYPGQLEKIFAMDADIRGFLTDHQAELE